MRGLQARKQLVDGVREAVAQRIAPLGERVEVGSAVLRLGLLDLADADADADADAEMESRITDALEEAPALLREARETVALVVEGNHNTVQQDGTNINISSGHDIRIGRLSDSD